MSRSDPQFKLRLPLELKERVEEEARKNKRSINAEIIARLELSFRSDSDVLQILQLAKDAITNYEKYISDEAKKINEDINKKPL